MFLLGALTLAALEAGILFLVGFCAPHQNWPREPWRSPTDATGGVMEGRLE